MSTYRAPARDASPQPRAPTGLGDRASCPGGGRCPWSAYGGWHSSIWQAHRLSGQGALPKRRQLPMERLRGNCSSQRRGPTGRGDGESCPGGNCCLGSACGGLQLPTARVQLGGWGALLRRWCLPTESLTGSATPNIAGPPAGGMGSLAEAVVAAYGTLVGDAGPQGRGPTGSGDGEPCRICGSCQ